MGVPDAGNGKGAQRSAKVAPGVQIPVLAVVDQRLGTDVPAGFPALVADVADTHPASVEQRFGNLVKFGTGQMPVSYRENLDAAIEGGGIDAAGPQQPGYLPFDDTDFVVEKAVAQVLEQIQ